MYLLYKAGLLRNSSLLSRRLNNSSNSPRTRGRLFYTTSTQVLRKPELRIFGHRLFPDDFTSNKQLIRRGLFERTNVSEFHSLLFNLTSESIKKKLAQQFCNTFAVKSVKTFGYFGKVPLSHLSTSSLTE